MNKEEWDLLFDDTPLQTWEIVLAVIAFIVIVGIVVYAL